MITLFLAEFVVYPIATLNYRFCAKGWVPATFYTVSLACLNFIIIRLVASDATTMFDMAGYVLGAGLGSLAGMRLTKGLKEHGE